MIPSHEFQNNTLTINNNYDVKPIRVLVISISLKTGLRSRNRLYVDCIGCFTCFSSQKSRGQSSYGLIVPGIQSGTDPIIYFSNVTAISK